MSYVLQSKVGGDYKPHPEGIHPAVCVDLIELGLVETEWLGQRRLVNKLRLVFETEQRNEEGKNCIVGKTFTASLHPKAKLADFIGKWRGRPVVPGESIDLANLVGACSTLVISHQQNMVGRTYASIDAVSKPTKRVAPSGHYDPALARQRIAEWKARDQGQGRVAGNQSSVISDQGPAVPQQPAQAASAPKSSVPSRPPMQRSTVNAQPSTTQEFDPEVGF